MIQNLFPQFLHDPSEYALAERHWLDLWTQLPYFDRAGWRTPWLRAEGDGNPMFTAFSPSLMKAIRVIQFGPTSVQLDFGWYLDTFGGGLTDPTAFQELVIACALSAEASAQAKEFMAAWLVGGIEITQSNQYAIGQVRRSARSIRRSLPVYDFTQPQAA